MFVTYAPNFKAWDDARKHGASTLKTFKFTFAKYARFQVYEIALEDRAGSFELFATFRNSFDVTPKYSDICVYCFILQVSPK